MNASNLSNESTVVVRNVQEENDGVRVSHHDTRTSCQMWTVYQLDGAAEGHHT